MLLYSFSSNNRILVKYQDDQAKSDDRHSFSKYLGARARTHHFSSSGAPSSKHRLDITSSSTLTGLDAQRQIMGGLTHRLSMAVWRTMDHFKNKPLA